MTLSWDIHLLTSNGGEGTEQKESEKAEKQQRDEMEEARRVEDTQQEDLLQMEETVPGKTPRTERSESEMGTKGGGKARLTANDCQAQERTYDQHLLHRLS